MFVVCRAEDLDVLGSIRPISPQGVDVVFLESESAAARAAGVRVGVLAVGWVGVRLWV
jgi:hypothetical protein